jgi:hypothetical protein
MAKIESYLSALCCARWPRQVGLRLYLDVDGFAINFVYVNTILRIISCVSIHKPFCKPFMINLFVKVPY